MPKHVIRRSGLSFVFVWLLTAASPSAAQADPLSESVARAYGISVDEARAQLALLEEANALGNRLEREEPTRYGGLRVERGKTTRIFVRLVGGADQLLARYTRNPAFVAEQAQIPLVALRNKAAAISNALRGKGNAGVFVDIPSGRIKVGVPDVEGTQRNLQAVGASGPEVDVEKVDRIYGAAATLVGGYETVGKYWTITGTTTNVRSRATLGFVVKTSAGTRGILTAGHFDECKFSQPVNGCVKNSQATDTRTGAPLNYQGQQLGGDLDYEWRTTTTSHNFTNQIYYGANMAITQVYDARAYQPGTLTVCKMGRTTGYTCGTVQDCTSWMQDTVHGINGAFCRVSNNAGGSMADEGDSGGPVFGSATAFGITSAKITGGAYLGQMVFMPIQKISGLGLSVLTTP